MGKPPLLCVRATLFAHKPCGAPSPRGGKHKGVLNPAPGRGIKNPKAQPKRKGREKGGSKKNSQAPTLWGKKMGRLTLK